MNQQELDESLRKSVQAASDKRSGEAVMMLALAVGIPFAIFFLFVIFGG